MTDSRPHLPEERQALIRDRLARQGRVLAADLAREWRTSEDTIRRDLRELAARGLCRRVHGGALPPVTGQEPLGERLAADGARKARLAATALELVAPEMVLFLDAGSTNAAIARALPLDRGLRVATNAPTIAAALLERGGIPVVQIGGAVDPHTGACLGIKALEDLDLLRPDLFFLGGCAVDRRGVSVVDHGEALFKAAVVARSAAVACAVTNAKLGAAAPFRVLGLDALTWLVVEGDAPAPLLEDLSQGDLVVVGGRP
jgi:DeoR/GlpR family transcriptional regulator of sugar metabolism